MTIEKWIVITGASSGIGEATARRLGATRQHNLLLVARREDILRSLATEIMADGAPEVQVLPSDITTPEAAEDMVSWLSGGHCVSALVNSAGIGRFGPVPALGKDDIEHIISTNLTGLILFSQPIIAHMSLSMDLKTVVNVSSDCESTGFADASIYGATKGGVYALSRAWQSELRKSNIRVCNIAPGRVDTHFNGKSPGMRPGALSADEVAHVIEYAINCPRNIEIRQIEIDSMSR